MYARYGQISPVKAQAICDQFTTTATSKIKAVPGYQIKGTRFACAPLQDEMGNTDYNVGANYLLVKQSSQPIANTDIQDLSTQLPRVQETWQVANIIDTDNRSLQICARITAYVDNDGKFYPQESVNNSAAFFTATTDNGYSGDCVN